MITADLPMGPGEASVAARNAFSASKYAYQSIPRGPWGFNPSSMFPTALPQTMNAGLGAIDPRDTWRSRCGNAGDWRCGGGPIYSFPWKNFPVGTYPFPRAIPYRCPPGFKWNQQQQECWPAGGLNGLGAMTEPCPQYFRYDPNQEDCIPGGPPPAGDDGSCAPNMRWAAGSGQCVPGEEPHVPPLPEPRPMPMPMPVETAEVTVKTEKRRSRGMNTCVMVVGASLAIIGLVSLAK